MITGAGFTPGATVSVAFGTVQATDVDVVSATEITAVSPPGAGTVDVIVTVGPHSSALTAPNQFGYVPAVSGISPASGPPAGGTPVTITGAGFTAGAAVAFGSVPAASMTVVSSTEIIATSPASPATGPVTIVVTVGGVPLTATGPDQFTYLPAITGIDPMSGTSLGGTRVIITGIGFAPGITVKFGSVQSTTVRYMSSTEIIAASPGTGSPPGTANVTVDITVTVGTLTSVDTSADLFTYK
jgi:hypothetical protein